jgi:hypothetical protein
LAISIEVTGADEAAEYFRAAGEALVQAVSVRLEAICQEIADYARQIAPRRSGQYAASITVEQEAPLRFAIRAGDPKAAIIEYGSMPHFILPRAGKVLRFEVDGDVVFAKWVHHPGTPPFMIIHTAKKDNLSKIMEAIRDGVREALAQGGR